MQALVTPGPHGPSLSVRNRAAFWVIGLLNNSCGAIMLAGAKLIKESGVGLVFLASVGPGLLLQASSPWWIHTTTYRGRAALVSTLLGAPARARAAVPAHERVNAF